MRSPLTRRRVEKARMLTLQRHGDAKTSPALFESLLRGASSEAHPWELWDNMNFTSGFRKMSAKLQREHRTHHSLRAHYGNIEDLAIGVLFRAMQIDSTSTGEQLRSELQEIWNSFEELDELNDEAWAKEGELVAVADAARLVLEDARRTVR